ncbi:hypothetical protein [Schleiferilactobacillus perolens]|uniref:Uncharacterized protein n=1 Tax=Schleiferilactobacillus perolens DSM 12744 TaxID=1423792 RepID=A0A0R1N4R3_9LACO|nr:hypothetical protein [Schleiferilactobacillus perolens]KRL12773.1 hypothetical protein FD09_GL002760 [Schleiferilactobacillus perolens DSM 12744]
MRRLIQLYWFKHRVKTTSRLNGFFWFLRHLPWIGKKISPRVFQLPGLKLAGAVIIAIARLAMAIGFSLLVFLIGFLGSDLYFSNILQTNPKHAGLFVAAMFATLTWATALALLRGFVLTDLSIEKEDLDLADQFGIGRQDVVSEFAIGGTISSWVTGALIPLTLFAILSRNPWLAITGLGISALTLLWGEFLPRFTWHHQNRAWPSAILYWLVMVVIPVLFFFTGRLITLAHIVFSPIGAAIVWVLNAAFLYTWWQFKDTPALLTEAIMTQLGAQAVLTKAKSNQYLDEGTTMQQKLTVNTTGEMVKTKTTGNNYLNTLLFARYQKQLMRKFAIRAGMIAAVGIAGLLVIKIFGTTKNFTNDGITSVYGLLFFVMFLASFGRPIVQMLFVNCDSAMLYYPFYRQRQAILKGFFYRFGRTALLNSGISALIFVLFLGLYLVAPYPPNSTFYLVLALELVGLTLFFSFHELFLYYLLQPFTDDMNVTSPVYKTIYGAMYWVSFGVMRANLSGYGYAIAIGVITLLYVAIGTAVIYQKAPQTFRVKS